MVGEPDACTKLRPAAAAAAVINTSESLPPVIRQRVIDQVVEAIEPDATAERVEAAAEVARTNAEAEDGAIVRVIDTWPLDEALPEWAPPGLDAK